MGFTILGTPLCLRDIVIRTRYLMLMSFMPWVGMCLPLEVVWYHRGLANRPFWRGQPWKQDSLLCTHPLLRQGGYMSSLMDLPVVEKPVPAILMNCDNQTVIIKVNNAKNNAKSSRHVKRRLKSVRKLWNSGVISVTYISTEKNLADPFTKGLSRYETRVSCHSSNPTYVIGDFVN